MQHAIAQHSAATAAPARASLRRAAPARAAVRVHAQVRGVQGGAGEWWLRHVLLRISFPSSQRVGAAAATGTYVAVNRYRLVDPSTQSAFEAEVAARAKAAAAQVRAVRLGRRPALAHPRPAAGLRVSRGEPRRARGRPGGVHGDSELGQQG